MRVYLVLAWDDYYPAVNNIKGSFLNLEKAKEFRNTLNPRSYDHIEIDYIEIKA